MLLIVCVYLLGGFTFLPGLIFILWRYAGDLDGDTKPREFSEFEAEDEGDTEPLIPTNVTEKPVFSGWVTVTKEYFEYPSGDIPDKKDNPSAYTSLYKLANGNGNGNSDTNAADKDTNNPAVVAANTATATAASPKPKPVKSRYYAELKLGNLFLYKSEERDLQHAIVLNKYKVQLYPELPDANLLAKRVAVCLTHIKKDLTYYIFVENCSLKEDLYFRIIEHTCQNSPMGKPLMFDHHDMINIIQKLHSSDENLQTAWFNALTARMFMAAYQTDAFRGYFEEKIVKKLARVKRPAFLSEIQVTRIDVGTSIPFLTTPKLRELKPDGTLVVAAHLSYNGGYTIEISTKATFNFGQKLINIKPRPVTLVLRLTLSKMEGIVVFQVKPPPSTRIWWGFESMPEMSLKVEPVVSARQITYSMVTNVIESKIREIVKESIVLPFTEDINFFPSQPGNPYRGGLWQDHVGKENEEETKEEELLDEKLADNDDESILSETPSPSIHVGMRHRTFRASPEEDEVASDSAAAASAVGAGLASAAASTSSLAHPATPDNDSLRSTTTASTNFMGTMKKWGAWYTEKKAEATKKAKPAGGFASVARSSTAPNLTADATVSLSPAAAITHRKPSEKKAPQPHHFPPEMIDLINEQERKRKMSNPDQPIGMELPGSPTMPGSTMPGSPPSLPPRSNTASVDTDKNQFVKRKPVRAATSVSPTLQSSPSMPVAVPARESGVTPRLSRDPLGLGVSRESGVSPSLGVSPNLTPSPKIGSSRESGVAPRMSSSVDSPVARESGVAPKSSRDSPRLGTSHDSAQSAAKLATSRSRDSLASMSSFREENKVSVVSLPVEEGSPPKEALVFHSHKASPLSAVQTPPASDSPMVSRVPRKPVGAVDRDEVNGVKGVTDYKPEVAVKEAKEVKEVVRKPVGDASSGKPEEETFPLEL
ncbi:putative PH domain-containing protein [Yarrowia sp. E02]|nr:putative PH domain-containing protein [Yarrowia sp. E02]